MLKRAKEQVKALTMDDKFGKVKININKEKHRGVEEV